MVTITRTIYAEDDSHATVYVECDGAEQAVAQYAIAIAAIESK